MAMPGSARQLVELLPIAFVPSVHSFALFESFIGCGESRKSSLNAEPGL